MEINYISYGIGSRIGNKIYLNKNLKENQVLHDAILKHELAHSEGYTIQDIKMDIRNTHLKGLKAQYYSFILKHPLTLIQFMPVWFWHKKTSIDLTMLIAWAIFVLFIVLLIWLI